MGSGCVNDRVSTHNRGWFPQAFSIIDGQKVGVTIHEIDDQLNHGPIIAQQGMRSVIGIPREVSTPG